MTGTDTSRILTGFMVAILCAAAAPAAAAEEDYGYGFYRTVEGEALLTTLEEDAEALEIEPNYPVLVGDRLWVAAGARVEAVLPDKSVLRLDEETEVFFESLTGSADAAEDATTILHLLEGEMQVVGEGYVLSDAPVRIDTPNSSVFLRFPGTYRLISDGGGWTEVVVRGGFAEINTERGSVVLRDGESAEIAGDRRPEVSVAAAGSWDRLEQWGAELSNEALARIENVDDSLAYAAAPLERSGYWVSVAGRNAWRPSVRVGWRPYSDGWWVHTPSGLSWVAYEPWGWVTSHYGAWDYLPGHGWLWFPGASYSPAWVYWYWGPTHTAWVPAGYYTRFYGPRYGWDFRFGVYGWAGGYWDSWSSWTFCPTRYFGRRDYRSYWRSGHEMHRDRRLRAVPRGIITTDTRDVTPRRWGKPTEIIDALERRHAVSSRSTRTLGDVSAFVERRGELPDDTRRIVGRGTSERNPGASANLPRTTRSGAARVRDAETPWRVERPDSVRALPSRGSTAPATRLRSRDESSQWEVIERLRRFETKEQNQAVPRSPRGLSSGSDATTFRRVDPRSGTPTRQILDSVRSRNPASRGPTARPPLSQRREPAVRSEGTRVTPRASSGRRGVGSSVSAPPSAGSRSVRPARPSTTSKPQASRGSSSGSKSGTVSRSRPKKPN